VAYSGGPGGVQHQATSEEQIAAHETHTPPTTFQTQHVQTAQTNKLSYAKNNGGRPATLVASKPLAVETKPAPPNPPKNVGNAAMTPKAGVGTEAKLPPTNPPTNTHPGTVSPKTVETPKTYTPPKTEVEPKTTAPPKPMVEPKAPPAPKTNTAPKPAPKPKPEPKGKPE
jgi:hypothetical protein